VELGRTESGSGFDTFTYPDFLDLRAASTGLEAVAAYNHAAFSHARAEGGERRFGTYVTSGYFAALGVRPARGRFFLPAEDGGRGTGPVVVVSDAFWRDRLDADPEVLGRTISLNRHPLTIVGVAPAGFHGHVGIVRSDVWVPLSLAPTLTGGERDFARRDAFGYSLIARLAPGATLEGAQAAVSTVMARIASEFPESHQDVGARVAPLTGMPAAARPYLAVFFGALGGLVLLVLLVTCANVAGTLLARAASRQREIAVRLAVGAGRGRLVRQLVAEALVLFALGGAVGLAIAYGATSWLSRISLPLPVPLFLDLTPHAGVLLAGLGLALATGLAFGLAPALQATRPDLVAALKLGAGAAGDGRALLQRGFVIGQVALTVLLVSAGGLFLRALDRAGAVETGFDPSGALVTDLDLTLDGVVEPENGVALVDAILAEAASIPGARTAAATTDLPLDGSRSSTVLRHAPDPEEDGVGIDIASVSPGYFDAIGVRFVAGRDFARVDGRGGELVMIVSRSLAERAWPGRDPIGLRAYPALGDDLARTVVGVVDDVKTQFVMETSAPAAYLPLAQRFSGSVQIVLDAREPLAATALALPLRDAILRTDPSLSVTRVVPLEDLTALGVLPQRIGARVLAILGLLAVALSGLGIYGIVAFRVARRTRELGIRAALGAERRHLAWLVVRSAAGLALPGVLVGIPLAAGAGYLLRSLLLGVHPLDPAALAGVAVFVALMVLAGSLVPALRAARIQPSEALRHE
jgi:predicted permease